MMEIVFRAQPRLKPIYTATQKYFPKSVSGFLGGLVIGYLQCVKILQVLAAANPGPLYFALAFGSVHDAPRPSADPIASLYLRFQYCTIIAGWRAPWLCSTRLSF